MYAIHDWEHRLIQHTSQPIHIYTPTHIHLKRDLWQNEHAMRTLAAWIPTYLRSIYPFFRAHLRIIILLKKVPLFLLLISWLLSFCSWLLKSPLPTTLTKPWLLATRRWRLVSARFLPSIAPNVRSVVATLFGLLLLCYLKFGYKSFLVVVNLLGVNGWVVVVLQGRNKSYLLVLIARGADFQRSCPVLWEEAVSIQLADVSIFTTHSAIRCMLRCVMNTYVYFNNIAILLE